jgi:serine protease
MPTLDYHPEPEDARRDYDPSPPPPEVLARRGARVLDPATAERIDGVVPRSTVYVGDRLIFPVRKDADELVSMLAEVAGTLGLAAELDRDDDSLEYGVNVVRFVPRSGEPTRPPDAWSVLQWTRSRFGVDTTADLSLEHVLGANARIMQITSATQQSSNPEDERIAEFIRHGGGHRQPVAPLPLRPRRTRDDEVRGRRPVVAILDTGCGSHAWLDGITQRGLVLDGRPVGSVDAADRTMDGTGDEMSDAVAGHGTFMAGLVHMVCPDAELVAIRVVGDDGLVEEHDLARTLGQLVELVRRDRAGEEGGWAVDVVVLSTGYYDETDGASPFAPILAASLAALGRMGVIIVAAAGNDATSRPMYPAALAPWEDGGGPSRLDDSAVPVVSVGAQNPDGSAALFSNAGSWVRAWAHGAAVVSTMPDTPGSQRSHPRAASGPPGSIDPYDYSSGFAVWSGTSFAAPVVAGQLASALIQAALGHASEQERVARAWEAVRTCTGLRP